MSRKSRLAARRRSKPRTRRIWIASRRWALSRGPATRRRRFRPVRKSATSACWVTTRSKTSPAGRRWKRRPRASSLGPADWAVRCNLVTIEDQVMRDFTADHITTEDATACSKRPRKQIASDPKYRGALEFVPGVSYRNLLLWRGDKLPCPFTNETRTRAPHDITDQSVLEEYPRGPGSDVLCDLMAASIDVFRDHPVNAARRAAGKGRGDERLAVGTGPGAAAAGLYGSIRPARRDDYGGRSAPRASPPWSGWDRIEVPGATGYLDTDYAAKGRAGVEALKKYDIVCVHVEASDEASHEGRCDEKVKAIEEIDRHIVGPLLAALQSHGDWRIMISPDHPTFLRTKVHTHGNVPVAMAGTGIAPDEFKTYGDTNAAKSKLAFDEGWKVMPWFIGKK